ncbi:MAG: phosphoenolpyruvate carboxykinase (ATP) [Planctomycetes bacterium]|nr:phosphoenolpyruvate carboxykinase (ATP) [Planctomycetota bacterium]
MPVDLSYLGIVNTGQIFHNLSAPALYEEAIRRSEGHVAASGPLVVHTGTYTGRSANDKFIVKEGASADKVWWGKVNRPFEPAKFAALQHRVAAYLQGSDLFVLDCFAGTDPEFRLPVRIITEKAWQNLFAQNMFVRITDPKELAGFTPKFTIIAAPSMHAVKDVDGTNSEAFIILNLEKNLGLIGGTHYAGEIKKSVFSVLNYILPQHGVMPMHCSANIGPKGDSAVFFGLSGTGKTTLSADPKRKLIGDDEHGWSNNGVFNFEGGCYAKVINLSAEAEPEIYATTRRFGTILENVAFDAHTRAINLNDNSRTENTRASYPIDFIPNFEPSGRGGQPKNVVFLTADAYGIFPPIAKLTPAQAAYHFISGYTAKVAGTERGVKEPSATFSACFGAPFMPLHPGVYAKLLSEKIAKTGAKVWMVNTGWTGGPYGVGTRMKIAHTRAMLNAALDGLLDKVPTVEHATLRIAVPKECPGVPPEVLDPRSTWKDKAAYDKQAAALAKLFTDNFEQFKSGVAPDIASAGPKA